VVGRGMGGSGCVGAMGHGGAGGRLTTLENFLWTLVTFSSWPSCRMIQVSWSAVKGLALVIVDFVKSERKNKYGSREIHIISKI
jgi:hypothetical protein